MIMYNIDGYVQLWWLCSIVMIMYNFLFRYTCSVAVGDNLQSCYTDYYYSVYYTTSYQSWKICWNWKCYFTKYRAQSYAVRFRRICGILHYEYSCTSE